MTAEKLLLPRFEVIADYPNANYKVGDILEMKAFTSNKYFHNSDDIFVGNFFTQADLENYPHLFKKIKWWEHRKAEDMPKKVICKAIPNDDEVTEIQEWDMDLLLGWINKEKRICCSLFSFNYEYGYFPID